jgi:hypothetical protein
MTRLPDPVPDPPRGTLLVVGVFGGLVALGWVLLYFGLFLPRATP